LSQVTKDLELFFDDESEHFTQWLATVIDQFKAKPVAQASKPSPKPALKQAPVVAPAVSLKPQKIEEKVIPKAAASGQVQESIINRQIKLQSIAHGLSASKPQREATPEANDDFISVEVADAPAPQAPAEKKRALFTKRKSSTETDALESGSREEVKKDANADGENIRVKVHVRQITNDEEEGDIKITVKNSPAQVLAASGSLIRCKYFPACTKGDKCEYFHPTEVCKYFPRCSNGNQCLFIHQNPFKKMRPAPSQVPCKFGSACTRPDCIFSHPLERQGPGAQPQQPAIETSSGTLPTDKKNVVCRFDTACTKILCPFLHPKRDSFVRKPDSPPVVQ